MQIPSKLTTESNPIEPGTPQTGSVSPSTPLASSSVQSAHQAITQTLQKLLAQTGNSSSDGLYQVVSSLITTLGNAWSAVNQLLSGLLSPSQTVVDMPSTPTPPPLTSGNNQDPSPGNSGGTPGGTTDPGTGGSTNPNPPSGGGSNPPGNDNPPGGNNPPGGGNPPGGNTPPDPGVIPGPDPIGGGNQPHPSLIPAHAREFDRTGEIEWRPRLNNGNLSIVFRPDHNTLAEKVEIFSADGTTLLATGTKSGKTEDGRPIYTFDRPGASFPDGAVVVMTFKDGKGVRRMTIPDSSEKYVHGTPQGNGSGSSGGSGGVGGGGSVNTGNQRSLVPSGAVEFKADGDIEWKATGNNGNLSMIFSHGHNSMAEKVQILSADGKTVLSTGVKAGTAPDGRPIYNFDKPGASFPPGAIVLMTLSDGRGSRKMTIKAPAQDYVHGTRPQKPIIPAGTTEFDKTGEIEWRPRLNNDNLAIIFRPSHATLAEKVEIVSPDGKTVLATGVRAGSTADGRPIYNFDKPGASFPDGSIVLMTYKDGRGSRKMTINETSEKYVHGTPKPPAGGSGSGSSNGAGSTGGSGSASGSGSSGSTGSAGNTTPTPPAPSLPPQFEKTGQIEWRPRLNNGKLSIIFRTSHASTADTVQIMAADGKTVLATGKRAGTTSDGRPIFNFDKAGGEFPDGCIVVMKLKNGQGSRHLTINETSDKFVF
jgi:hypothetical protein